jgi:DNA-directed RNA polymerase specialized sigma subunit
VAKIRDESDIENAQRVINLYAQRALNIAPLHLKRWISLDDLVQEGNLLLLSLRKRKTFDASRGVTFESFFSRCLERYYSWVVARACRRKRAPLAMESLSEDFDVAAASAEIDGVELRIELEQQQALVSRDAAAVLSWVLYVGAHRPETTSDVKLARIGNARGMSVTRTSRAVKELKRALKREKRVKPA